MDKDGNWHGFQDSAHPSKNSSEAFPDCLSTLMGIKCLLADTSYSAYNNYWQPLFLSKKNEGEFTVDLNLHCYILEDEILGEKPSE